MRSSNLSFFDPDGSAVSQCCGSNYKIEVHERWEYNEKDHIQKLRRLVALCHDCHEVTHIGLAEVRGVGDKAKKHLMKVRGWGEDQADRHINQAFEVWGSRNMVDWHLDLSLMTDNGIALKNQASTQASKRKGIAMDRLSRKKGTGKKGGDS